MFTIVCLAAIFWSFLVFTVFDIFRLASPGFNISISDDYRAETAAENSREFHIGEDSLSGAAAKRGRKTPEGRRTCVRKTVVSIVGKTFAMLRLLNSRKKGDGKSMLLLFLLSPLIRLAYKLQSIVVRYQGSPILLYGSLANRNRPMTVKVRARIAQSLLNLQDFLVSIIVKAVPWETAREFGDTITFANFGKYYVEIYPAHTEKTYYAIRTHRGDATISGSVVAESREEAMKNAVENIIFF